MRSEPRLVLAAIAGCVGCAGGNGAPVIERVEPALVSNLTATTVRVIGRNFYLDAHADLGGGPVAVDGTIAVALDDTALAGVVRVDEGHLEVVIPQGTPAGAYDLVVTTAGGVRARARDALEVTRAPVGLPLTIEDAPGGAGGVIDARALIAGAPLTLHAVVRTAGVFVAEVPVTWTVEGGIGELDTLGPSARAVLEPRRAGAGRVRARHPVAGDATTGALTVAGGPPAMIAIVDDAGADVGEVAVTTDDRPTWHAQRRDRFGNVLGPATATWAVTGGIGAIGGSPAVDAALDPTRPGAGTVTAADAVLGAATTGTITVTPGRAATLTIAPAALTRSADDPPVVFTAAGTDADDNPTSDVGALTWSVASGPIARLTAGGVLDPVTAGAGTLAVTSSHGVSALSGLITIVPGRAAALAITPSVLTCAAGDPPVAFAATATDADGNSTPDLGTLGWGIAHGPIAALDGATGLLTPVHAGAGRVRVTSSHGASGLSGDITVLGVARLTAALTMPARSPPGDVFTVTMTVASDGVADALAVRPSPLVATGGLVLVAGPSPASADLPIGGATTFAWTYRAVGAGAASLSGTAAGVDHAWGTAVTSAPAAAAMTVAEPARLRVELELPDETWRDAPFTAVMTVVNEGELMATMVAPSILTLTGTGAAVLVTSPAPELVTIAGGARHAFAWTFRATATGTLAVTGAAAGVDDNSGAVITAAAATAELAIAVAAMIDKHPFGGGTRAPYVFIHGGRAHIGPDRTGSGIVRFAADGTGGESVALAFTADTTGHRTANASAPPYPSLGASGCSPDTLTCGPDNEDGRGLFGAATLGGAEWLIAGGARTQGDLDYVYASDGSGATPAFSYVDLDDLLAATTCALSTMHAFGDRLYLGFAATGSGRPGLVALLAPPAGPGLDAIAGVDALDLAGADVGAAGGGTAMVDALGDLDGRLYVAGAGAWLRSTVLAPRPYQVAPEDWAPATPSAPAYSALASRTTTKTSDLEPADRAVPQMAGFGGRLFVGRNTVAGPQLWACTPASTGDPVGCDPDDWTQVAANAAGDARLTQLGDVDNATISLVVATSTHLYVGFDNAAGGLRLHRTAIADPVAADFEGPIGGAGFGSLTRPRIMASAAVGDVLYLVAARATDHASAWRIAY